MHGNTLSFSECLWRSFCRFSDIRLEDDNGIPTRAFLDSCYAIVPVLGRTFSPFTLTLFPSIPFSFLQLKDITSCTCLLSFLFLLFSPHPAHPFHSRSSSCGFTRSIGWGIMHVLLHILKMVWGLGINSGIVGVWNSANETSGRFLINQSADFCCLPVPLL